MAVQDNIDNSDDCCDHNHHQIHHLKPATKEQLPERLGERGREEEGEEDREGWEGEGWEEREESRGGRRREEGKRNCEKRGVKDHRPKWKVAPTLSISLSPPEYFPMTIICKLLLSCTQLASLTPVLQCAGRLLHNSRQRRGGLAPQTPPPPPVEGAPFQVRAPRLPG